jgi:hypothetical protein
VVTASLFLHHFDDHEVPEVLTRSTASPAARSW